MQNDQRKIEKAPTVDQPRKRFHSVAEWAVVLTYAVIVLSIVPFQKGWHNDGHSWLIARDSTLSFLLKPLTGYEGTPPLWVMLIMPLAKAGLPYMSLGILNATMAIAAVAVLVFLSPFAMWQKVAATFSINQLFMYGMVWRLYSLAGLLLLLAAYLFPSRLRKPITYAICVSLLANTCVQMLGVSFLLILEFAWSLWNARKYPALAAELPDRRYLVGALLIIGVSLAFEMTVLRRPPDATNLGLAPILYKPGFLELIGAPFVFSIRADPFYPPSPWIPSVVVCCFVAFFLLCWELRREYRALGLLLLTLLGWGDLFTFKFPPNVYHVDLMFYVVLAALWIAKDRANSAALKQSRSKKSRSKKSRSKTASTDYPIGTWIFFGAQAVTIIGAIQSTYLELNFPFSGAKEAADYVSKIDSKEVIAEYTDGDAESVMPYLPGRVFWRIQAREFRSFLVPIFYDSSFNLRALFTNLHEDFPKTRPWLLLIFPLPEPEYFGYQLVFKSSTPAWGLGNERFYLYCPLGREHPAPSIGTVDDLTLVRGQPYQPFDFKAIIKMLPLG